MTITDKTVIKSLSRDKDFAAFMNGSAVAKTEPSVASVHVANAGGDRKKPSVVKPLTFDQAISEVQEPVKSSADTCPSCSGVGTVKAKIATGETDVTCPTCNGTGQAPNVLAKKGHKSEVSVAGDVEDIGKADARALKPRAEGGAHSPFPHDPNALGRLREDQVPRFLGAITNPDQLETRKLPIKSLVAMQNRVDPDKVDAMRQASDDPEFEGFDPPVVVRTDGKNLIADGHHRAAAAWLEGENQIDTKYLNLTPKDEALKRGDAPVSIDKRFAVNVLKVIEDKQRIFGWASVVTKNGELIEDHQGDMISPEDIAEASYDFVLSSRTHGDMHEITGTGRLIASMPITDEMKKSLGLTAKDDDGDDVEGWIVGFQIDDGDTWAKIKAGERPELSIGGSGIRVPVGEEGVSWFEAGGPDDPRGRG